MDLEIISIVTFFIVIGLFLWKDKKKIEFNHGIIIRRMYRGRRALDSIIKKHKQFFKVFGNLGVIIAVATAFVGTALLMVFPIIYHTKSFAIVLPSVSSYKYPGPIISIPIWYWIIAVFVIMASHETMHAIMARLAGISINNYGLIFLLVLPIGAFVDPDMKKIAKLKLISKLRIYAAGSFGNFIVGLLVIGLFYFSLHATNLFIEPVGVKFESTTPDTPASKVGLKGIIIGIDDIKIEDRADLENTLKSIEPGTSVKILTTEGEFELTTIESPFVSNMSYLGIENVREAYKYSFGPFTDSYVSDYLINSIIVWYNLLSWLFMLSVGVAIVNLLPMKPLDGGYIFEEIARKYLRWHWKSATKLVSICVATMLIFNLIFFDLIKFLLSIFV